MENKLVAIFIYFLKTTQASTKINPYKIKTEENENRRMSYMQLTAVWTRGGRGGVLAGCTAIPEIAGRGQGIMRKLVKQVGGSGRL